jgi:uncharacterized lipoprotein NlpE involved in copper resistance
MKLTNFSFFILLFIFGLTVQIKSQQTIFNVPTTDVLEKGKIYLELDASFKLNNQQLQRRFSSFTPRGVVGIGRNVEVGLNLTGNIQPGADSTTLVPNAKWRFYQNEKNSVSLIAGTNLYIPVRRRAYNFGTYSYLAGSKTFNKNTRLTAGAFVASKNVFASKAVRGGGQFGVEHSINNKITFAADWFTGRHSAVYFSPGIIYKPHPKITTYFSYSIGNADAARGNQYFLFEIGFNPN